MSDKKIFNFFTFNSGDCYPVFRKHFPDFSSTEKLLFLQLEKTKKLTTDYVSFIPCDFLNFSVEFKKNNNMSNVDLIIIKNNNIIISDVVIFHEDVSVREIISNYLDYKQIYEKHFDDKTCLSLHSLVSSDKPFIFSFLYPSICLLTQEDLSVLPDLEKTMAYFYLRNKDKIFKKESLT